MPSSKKVSFYGAIVLWWAGVCAGVVLSVGSVPCFASTSSDQAELQRGIQSFNSKHYSDAVGHLQSYVAANPHESIGHYYLANCLFSLGYQKPSLEEYSAALRESTSQKMTDYCREAIRQMQSSKQTAVERQSAGRLSVASLSGLANFFDQRRTGFYEHQSNQPGMAMPLNGWQPPALPDGQKISVLDSSPMVVPLMTLDSSMLPQSRRGVSDMALEKALVRMTDQTNIQIETLQKDGAADLLSLKEHLADEISRLNRDNDSRIQIAIDNQRSGKGTASLDSTVDSIRRDTASRIQNAKTSYESQAETHQQQMLARIAKIVEASKLSQSQVADSRRLPDSPNLQVTGSDLYTRNYAPGPEPPPPNEMLATPERLVLDAHSRPGRSIYKVVRDPAAPPVAPGTDLKVHGELIK